MAQLRTLPLGDQVKTLMKNGRLTHLSKLTASFTDYSSPHAVYSGLFFFVSLIFSQGDAVCEPDGPACLWHRLNLSAALHPAGGAAGSGELGCEEVRQNSLSADVKEGRPV